MTAKRKKKKMKNRRKRGMNRDARLHSARESHWVDNYQGSSLVSGYRKKFKVDTLCAIEELKILGVIFPDGYEEQVRKSLEGEIEARKRRKEAQRDEYEWIEQNDEFAYIAGYTPGGVPYGVTWEEMQEIEEHESREWPDADDSEWDADVPA